MDNRSYSKGISWFDDCRIPFVDEKDPSAKRYETRRITDNLKELGYGFNENYDYKEQTGRFPANLLVSDDMLNDGIISKSSGHKRNNKKKQTIYGGGKGFPPIVVENVPDDKGTNSRYYDIDKWFNNLIDV
jgi:hypothetical protein